MNKIYGKDLIQMLINGGYYLKTHQEEINDLNVFPVPDGDTGSNMSQTYLAGLFKIKDMDEDSSISEVFSAFSKALLFGARGNSGVILSQIFSGLAKIDGKHEYATKYEIIDAFKEAVGSAYTAVVQPVEGTILTVVKDGFLKVEGMLNEFESIEEMMDVYLVEVEESLKRTREILPVLKEAGVVDSGARGFTEVARGIVSFFKGERHTFEEVLDSQTSKSKNSDYTSYDYFELTKYGYCTEFILRLNPSIEFKKDEFVKALENHGSSIVVVNREDVVKCHIHTKNPGDVFSFALTFGALCSVKAENMAIQTEENSSLVAKKMDKKATTPEKENGIIAVLNGDGLKDVFRDLGVDYVIDGGQTMNPSTNDFVEAINSLNAKHIYILPNNKNVYLSAKTAKALINDKHIIILPAMNIPEGYAALTQFDESVSYKENVKEIEAKIKSVESGEVTYAIRDSVSSGLVIHKNDFIAIYDKKIIYSDVSRLETIKQLLKTIISNESSFLTIFKGEGVEDNEVSSLEEYLQGEYPVLGYQIIDGGQKIYSYLLEIE